MAHTTSFASTQPIKIAILAMGGQGGGVLADWLVQLAENQGWWAQSTSVPGVAQRTGATIYYVELMPGEAVAAAGRSPTLALLPTPGDVDLVIAAELMEAGRAIQRGLVSPDRTVLIASSHRSYAIAEKSTPGNGIIDPNTVIEAGNHAARQFYCFDLEALARRAGSVISASLFGAVAASHALPFKRTAFEATIRQAGVGVEASLAAFKLGFEAGHQAPPAPLRITPKKITMPPPPTTASRPQHQALLDTLHRDFPAKVQPLAFAGVQRLLDYQDSAYARDYLDELKELLALDRAHGGAQREWALTLASARYLALAMAYDDVIRVADLKTRASRFDRVRQEVAAQEAQILLTTDYLHPRVEEICGTLPAGLGRWLEHSPTARRMLARFCRQGRLVATHRLGGFLLLYGLAGLQPWRRRLWRHQIEQAVWQEWLSQVKHTVAKDYDLALELIECRRLIKGYSDTHARGQSKYHQLLQLAKELSGDPTAAAQVKAARLAALRDVTCEPLRDARPDTKAMPNSAATVGVP